MDLRLKLSNKNLYPSAGVLVKGSSVLLWLKEIAAMGLRLQEIDVYPIPGTTANTIWGCLVITPGSTTVTDIRRHSYCQIVAGILFIPERSVLTPAMTDEEVTKILKGNKHLFHPETGLVELADAVQWESLVQLSKPKDMHVREVSASVFIPRDIRSFQVKPPRADAALNQLEEKAFPKKEKLPGESLNLLEKLKLFMYRQLFKKVSGGESNSQPSTEKKPLLNALDKIKRFFGNQSSKWTKNWEKDYEELEKRNQKQLDKLLELLKKNPEEALRYAIPLDEDGSSRGGLYGEFLLEKRWFDFSLFGNASGAGGGRTLMVDDTFLKLQQQYMATAEELVKQGNHIKAAFVYMKLLKNYSMAARTLEEGKHYAEAASVYLKYLKDKSKAAECFEKANMTTDAIALYKELNEFEKVGDLYFSLQKQEEGITYYQKVADSYIQQGKYLKASLLYKDKMSNKSAAQEVLLKGWQQNRDAFNCLNNYLNNIDNSKQRWNEIESISKKDIQPYNCEAFLSVLHYEYEKEDELSTPVKDLAYEIITKYITAMPELVSDLRRFNRSDKQLIKDTLRFKIRNRK